MNLRDQTSQTAATLILNASPDSALLNNRARILNDAGYYTSSARTSEEVVQYATTMNCAVALLCYSFAGTERQALSERLRILSPATTVMCLEPGLDESEDVLVSKVEAALAGLSA